MYSGTVTLGKWLSAGTDTAGYTFVKIFATPE
jgi:hypothetical protein